MHQISRVRQWKAALHTAYGRAQPLRGPAPYHRLLTASAYGLTRPYVACLVKKAKHSTIGSKNGPKNTRLHTKPLANCLGRSTELLGRAGRKTIVLSVMVWT